MAQFDNYNIVVTGGGSGIGLGISLLLSQRGATVWIVDLSPEPPAELKDLIASGKVHFYGSTDTSSREACTKFMDEVLSKAGRLDGLVNNAGIGLIEGEMATDEAFHRMMAVNVTGPWNYSTHALKAMKTQEPRGRWKTRGSIVTISSGAGLGGHRGLAVYCATKHAVIGLAKAQAQDFGGYGIRVNCIAPGVTWTPALRKRADEEAGFIDSMAQNAAGRFAETEEIAAGCAFLLSDEASHVNGQVLPISGG